MYSLILGKTVFLGNSKIRAFSPRNTDEVDPIVLFSAENSELAFAELRVSFRGDEIHRGLKLGIFQSLQSLSSAQAICMQVASAFNPPRYRLRTWKLHKPLIKSFGANLLQVLSEAGTLGFAESRLL